MADQPLAWASELCTLIEGAMLRLEDPDDQNIILYDDLINVWRKPMPGHLPTSALDLFRSDVSCFPTNWTDKPLEQWIRLVSILIWIRYDHWISLLSDCREMQWQRLGLDASFNDHFLPFTKEEINNHLFPSATRNHNRARTDFYKSQFAFKPAILEEDQLLEFEDKNHRLPLKEEGELNNTGSYGNVTKVKIARHHYRYRTMHLPDPVLNEKDFYAARKEFDVGYDFAREYQNLEILRSNHVDNARIMQSFARVIVGPKYNLFFSWADLDLDRFLHGEYLYDDQQASVTPFALVSEARQLLQTLQYLHESIQDQGRKVAFCHLDLKPNNILVVRHANRSKFPLGIWKITDFGISAVEPRAGNEAQLVSARELYVRSNRTGTMGGSSIELERFPGPFQPPEAEPLIADAFKRQGRRIPGTNSDVWSDGCIMLSVLAFGIGGPQCVEHLDILREAGGWCPDEVSRHGYFYRRDENNILQVTPAVREWFEDMASFRQGWLKGIWNIVAQHMLKIVPEERKSAAFVAGCLRSLEPQCPDGNIWTDWIRNVPVAPAGVQVRTETLPQGTQIPREQSPARSAPGSSKSTRQDAASRGNLLGPEGNQTTIATRHVDLTTTRDPMNTINEAVQTPGGRSGGPNTPRSLSVRGDGNDASVATIFRPNYQTELEVGPVESVKLSPDGTSILYKNKDRARVFFTTEQDGFANFTSERVRFFPRTGKQSWSEAHPSGKYVALRTNATKRGEHGEIHVSSLENSDPLTQIPWTNMVSNSHVHAMTVSPRGYVAFRLQKEVSVFNDSGVLQDMTLRATSQNLSDGVKSVSFDRSGYIVTAVSFKKWFACDLTNSFVTVSSRHQFFRGGHGAFSPSIIPLNSLIGFVLHDEASPGRCTLISHDTDGGTGYHDNDFSLEERPYALTVTPDNRRLVYVTIKRQLPLFKHQYFLRSRAMDTTARVPIGTSDLQRTLIFTEEKRLKISIAIVNTSEGWRVLAALADGRVGCFALK